MNSTFVGYKELSLLDLFDSSYPTQPHSLIAKYFIYQIEFCNRPH